jgi:hypothetical protein
LIGVIFDSFNVNIVIQGGINNLEINPFFGICEDRFAGLDSSGRDWTGSGFEIVIRCSCDDCCGGCWKEKRIVFLLRE